MKNLVLMVILEVVIVPVQPTYNPIKLILDQTGMLKFFGYIIVIAYHPGGIRTE